MSSPRRRGSRKGGAGWIFSIRAGYPLQGETVSKLSPFPAPEFGQKALLSISPNSPITPKPPNPPNPPDFSRQFPQPRHRLQFHQFPHPHLPPPRESGVKAHSPKSPALAKEECRAGYNGIYSVVGQQGPGRLAPWINEWNRRRLSFLCRLSCNKIQMEISDYTEA